MTRQTPLSEWFRDDPEQVEWAWQYFLKQMAKDKRRGMGPVNFANLAHAMNHGYEPGLLELRSLEHFAEGILALKRMRAAWTQLGSKKNRKVRPCTFNLSAAAERALEGLARDKRYGGNKSAAIDVLIARGFNFERDEAARRKQERDAEKAKKEQAAKGNLVLPPTPNPNALDVAAQKKIQQLMEENKAFRIWSKTVGLKVRQWFYYREIIEANGISFSLDKSRSEIAELNYKKYMDECESKVELAISGPDINVGQSSPT